MMFVSTSVVIELAIVVLPNGVFKKAFTWDCNELLAAAAVEIALFIASLMLTELLELNVAVISDVF